MAITQVPAAKGAHSCTSSSASSAASVRVQAGEGTLGGDGWLLSRPVAPMRSNLAPRGSRAVSGVGAVRTGTPGVVVGSSVAEGVKSRLTGFTAVVSTGLPKALALMSMTPRGVAPEGLNSARVES